MLVVSYLYVGSVSGSRNEWKRRHVRRWKRVLGAHFAVWVSLERVCPDIFYLGVIPQSCRSGVEVAAFGVPSNLQLRCALLRRRCGPHSDVAGLHPTMLFDSDASLGVQPKLRDYGLAVSNSLTLHFGLAGC